MCRGSKSTSAELESIRLTTEDQWLVIRGAYPLTPSLSLRAFRERVPALRGGRVRVSSGV